MYQVGTACNPALYPRIVAIQRSKRCIDDGTRMSLLAAIPLAEVCTARTARIGFDVRYH